MYHTSCTLHSVKGWLGSFVNIVLDIVTLYGLFHGTTYQSLRESFQITFFHLSPCLVCICVLHISSKLSMHSFGSLFIFSLFFCSFLEFFRVKFFLVCYSSAWLVFFLFFLLGFTSCKFEQPLQGMELQEKNHKKDYKIQKICLERIYN